MDNEILKDIAFSEAINDRAKRDPLMERAISNKKPLADYVINVLVFESMTAEQFFTDTPYQAHAAQIRQMRESYESLAETDAGKAEEKNDLAEAVAELKKELKALTENQADETAPKTDEVEASDTEDEDSEDDTEADTETEE